MTAIVPNRDMSLAQLEAYQEVLRETREALADEIPANTKSAYDRDWSKFESWCDTVGFQAMPASEETITGYMTHLAFGEKRKPATILRRLFGITHRHRKHKNKYASPITEEVRNHLRQIRRNEQVNSKRKEAPPLMVSDLEHLVSAMNNCPSALREVALRDKAILLLGWNCAFRRSEIVGLEVRDLINIRGNRSVVVRKSKTDQEGQGSVLPLNPAKRRPHLCPLRAIDAWLEFRGDAPGALFWKISERIQSKRLVGGVVLTDTAMPWIQVNRMMTWWPMLSELEAPEGSRFSPHSMRAGYITETALAGELPSVIMARSRHKSLEVFNRYIRVALSHDNDPTKAVI